MLIHLKNNSSGLHQQQILIREKKAHFQLSQISKILGVALLAFPVLTYSALLFVDGNNPNCSNLGSGSQSVPFCSIDAAADEVEAGDTVSVKPGTYNEEVYIRTSGSPSSPISFIADSGVTVSGQYNGFDLDEVNWVTVQGFTVGQTTSHGIKAVESSNLSFTDNVVISAGERGIYVRDSSEVIIDNNRIQDSTEQGIFLKAITNGTINNNEVTGSGHPFFGATRQGIYVNSSSNLLIENNISAFNTDTGIYLTSGTTGVHIKSNTLHDNARGYTRAANGINIRNSTNNIIEGNIAYNNEDSGIQFYPGAHNNLGVNNLSYDNGDHGLDTLNATGNRWIGNSVYGNFTSGINVEGGSTNTTVMNNISVDNGINSTRKRGNINFVVQSIAGSTADYNLVHLSAPGVVYVCGITSIICL